MIPNPFANTAPPALRRPSFQINFGGDSDAWLRCLVSLKLELGLAPHVDWLELRVAMNPEPSSGFSLTPSPAWPEVAIGDQGTLKLGYEDGTHKVFSGEIESVTRYLDGTMRITAVNGSAALAKTRINKAFEQQDAGQLVKDLCGNAGVSTGSVENGNHFAYMVLDQSKNAWEHIQELAKSSGYICYVDQENKLQYLPQNSSSPIQTFSYGQDIIQLEVRERSPLIESTAVIGEGAAGSQGKEAWSWLVKDPSGIKGEAGQGEPYLKTERSGREKDAVTNAATAWQQRSTDTNKQGRCTLPGAPEVMVNTTIEIKESNQEVHNGKWLVTHLKHQYNKHHGFITYCQLNSGEAEGSGLFGGLF